MEVRGCVNDITVYDDFAHHPTAITTTLQGLRAKVGDQRIFAVLQFGSNTMSSGFHRESVADALKAADSILLLKPEANTWDLQPVINQLNGRASAHANVNQIIEKLSSELKPNDHVLIMSNKGFDDIHQRLLEKLRG